MKPSFPALPSSALAVLLALPCTVALANPPGDAVAVDPAVHRVLFENEHVRVFDARASHGATSPMHSHPPFVFIGLDTARVRLTLPDGSQGFVDTYPGQAMWMGEPLQHSWELLSGDLHVIAVEIKSAQQGTAPAAVERRADDSVAVDPAVHRVLFENEHVRVLKARVSAGTKSPMHSHPPSVLVVVDGGRNRVQMPDGSTQLVDLEPGQAIWMAEGARHQWEMLAGSPHGIIVEPKSAHPRGDAD
ncbi:MAG TPA: hypothetical protein VFG21_05155 [Xanthomonadaceae bacterium]|nr:hypothetical protein [Xanthomonadaceae bacterium]